MIKRQKILCNKSDWLLDIKKRDIKFHFRQIYKTNKERDYEIASFFILFLSQIASAS
jgi:hypothetical protein